MPLIIAKNKIGFILLRTRVTFVNLPLPVVSLKECSLDADAESGPKKIKGLKAVLVFLNASNELYEF